MAENKSTFKKVIDEKNTSGDLKRQYAIELSPWHFDADPEKGTKAMSGFTCRIGVLKLGGTKPSNNFVHIDPANKELRQALTEMYAEYDKVSK